MAAVEEETIDFAQIPTDLFSYIVEKMVYRDFAKFNSCCNFSKGMCESLPKGVSQYISFSEIEVQNDGDIYADDEELSIEEVPQNVLIQCERFTAHVDAHETVLQFVRTHRISAEEVLFEYLDAEPEYINNLLEVLKPHRFGCVPCNNEILKLEPVCEVLEIWTGEDDTTTDEVIVKLAAVEMKLDGDFTTNGVFELIQQWIIGDREIDDIQLSFVRNYDLGELISRLEAVPATHFQDPTDINRLYICKTPDHTDCLKLQADVDLEMCEIEISATSEEDPCPKRKEKCGKRRYSQIS